MLNFIKLSGRPTSMLRSALVVPVLVGSLGLAACTSGASNGSPSSTPPSNTTSAGPSGAPTSPANPSLSSVASANPLVYSRVSKEQAKKLETIASRAPGVNNVAYAPQQKMLEIFLKSDITKNERVVVDRVVTQVLHPASAPKSSSSRHH